MPDEGEWTVEYYVDERGTVPVKEFLAQLEKKTYTRFLWSIEQLRVRNVRARYPLVRQIQGQLWELREESQTTIYRIFYFFAYRRRIVLLHGVTKKSEKLPSREIEVAMNRMKYFVKTEGGD